MTDNSDFLTTNKSDIICAPANKYHAGSCAKLHVLIEIAKAYNYANQPSKEIKLNANYETSNPQKYKRYLVQEIKNRLGDKCDNQKCWMTQKFIKYMNEQAKEEFLKYTFRPDAPQGRFEWLSTFDINDSMSQYEKKYNDFKFFGAVPMDFAELPTYEIGKVNYSNYYNKGIRRMGVIFNLDNHDQKGSHWVALFTNLNKGQIFYYDSFGIKPEERVRHLIRQQQKFLESIGMNNDTIRIDYNRKQHQRGNSECGVYSMNFLLKMLKGDNFDEYCNTGLSDKKVNKCRKIYFDKYSSKFRRT